MVDATIPATSGAESTESIPATDLGVDSGKATGSGLGIDIPPTANIPSASQLLDAGQPFSSQLDMNASSQLPPHPNPYNMAAMGQALPQGPGFRSNQYPTNAQHRFGAVSPPQMMHQMPQMGHYSGHSPVPMAGQGYYVQQHPPMAPYQGHGPGPHPPAQSSPGLPQRQAMGYYPNQMMMNYPQSHQYYYPQSNQYSTHPAPAPGPIPQPVHAHYVPSNTSSTESRSRNVPSDTPSGIYQALGAGLGDKSAQNTQRDALETDRPPEEAKGRQSTVRGPPRKPRQSGHALWVGNLPPQTDLMSLVHHVCRETPGLESLFLISKSNCAFANFKDEATCAAAQQKLHDSKFQSVRLVSRLRKSTVEAGHSVQVPTGPSPSSEAAAAEQGADAEVNELEKSQVPTSPEVPPSQKAVTAVESGAFKDKFFVLKSLTVEDLGLSVQTGIWATQSHNEEVLNNAYKAVDNVYLVFSANKSGEYFGYARMTSEINDDPAAAVKFAPASQATTLLDLPKAIPTEATEYAPKGRIIDDSTRGTIFWEAEREDGEESDDETDAGSIKSGQEEEDGKTWGKPFKLEWLSTTRLPFYRTRGLRNPWNSNREVKIARDGTELEPSVGRRLIGLFNRVQHPSAASGPVAQRPSSMTGVPGAPGGGSLAGYGQVRTFGP